MRVPSCWGGPLPALAILLAGAGLLAASPLQGQDTLSVADTLAPGVPRDSLPRLPSDSVAPDSLVVRALPPVPGGRPARDPGLLARWDREELVRHRAVTLLELLAPLPGVVPLRSGDFGSPEGVIVNGRAGGRLRIFTDGVEEVGLDGSVPDLAHVTLGGVERVEVVQAGGETRIFLTTLQATVPDPVSRIEAGTGDLDTNVFRGTFVHPSAFGGALALLFDRLDTDGPGGAESGSLQTVWLRYLHPVGDRVFVSGEIRTRSAESGLDRAPPTTKRLTRSLRARAVLAEGVTAELFVAENKLDLTSDSAVAESPRTAQYGARVGWEVGLFSGGATLRHLRPTGSEALLRGDLDAVLARPSLGGVSGRLGWDRGGEETRTVLGIAGWTRTLAGLSLFGSLDRGARGWGAPSSFKLRPRPDSVAALLPRGSDATFLRAGARLDLGPVRLEGAWLQTEVDSVLPLGNRVDQGTRAFPGDKATGFEVSGSVGLPVDGLAVEGSLQQWEREGILRPGRVYRGGLTFHDTFYPTGNLEVTASFLAEGRDPMLLPLLDANGGPVRVPFYQSWNAHLQIRVVTVRVFVRWDNLFIRQNNQDLPGRTLLRTRAMYGVRWTLTN